MFVKVIWEDWFIDQLEDFKLYIKENREEIEYSDVLNLIMNFIIVFMVSLLILPIDIIFSPFYLISFIIYKIIGRKKR